MLNHLRKDGKGGYITDGTSINFNFNISLSITPEGVTYRSQVDDENAERATIEEKDYNEGSRVISEAPDPVTRFGQVEDENAE